MHIKNESAATRMRKMAFWMACFFIDLIFRNSEDVASIPLKVYIHPSKFPFSSGFPFLSSHGKTPSFSKYVHKKSSTHKYAVNHVLWTYYNHLLCVYVNLLGMHLCMYVIVYYLYVHMFLDKLADMFYQNSQHNMMKTKTRNIRRRIMLVDAWKKTQVLRKEV